MILEKIGRAAMLEQLAEEAAELSHAALKAARIERGENPTPVTLKEAEKNLTEEYTDVITCGNELGLCFDMDLYNYKMIRFKERLNEEDDLK